MLREAPEYLRWDGRDMLTGIRSTEDGWTYFSYDGNGNTVSEQTPAYTRYYDWDGRDMLTGVQAGQRKREGEGG